LIVWESVPGVRGGAGAAGVGTVTMETAGAPCRWVGTATRASTSSIMAAFFSPSNNYNTQGNTLIVRQPSSPPVTLTTHRGTLS